MLYKKSAIYGLVILILITISLFFIMRKPKPVSVPVVVPQIIEVREVIGTSTEGRIIESYNYGDGSKHLLFVGGMHGGYEWNSVLLAYSAMDYFKANPDVIPKGMSVTIIPNINPDGVYKVVGKEGRFEVGDVNKDKTILASGRFNAHGVDLNRNFDCKWQPSATWQNKKVGAGTSAFSEPESLALKNYINKNKPTAVVFWHSQANAVYASECKAGILPVTLDIMKAYADAGGYPSVKSFSAYPVAGDAEGWLASIGIPAITVELSTHESIEWNKNLAGVKAMLKYFNEEKKDKITYKNATSDLIQVSLPYPGAVTGKEFSVVGKARGNWFFEASFPIEVLDKDGKVLFQGPVQAQGDWMTTEFVAFKVDIKIPETYIGPATLVLKKDNPSGLPEHDASISFPFTIEY